MAKLKQVIAIIQMGSSTIAPSDQLQLEQFARQSQAWFAPDAQKSDRVPPNVCSSCYIIMEVQGDFYICSRCRCRVESDNHISTESYSFKSRDSRRYYSSSDPSSEQRSGVYESLVEHRERYLKAIAEKCGLPYIPNSSLVDGSSRLCGFAPSTEILIKVANIYHDIQRKSSANGSTFTKRGEVKNDILAAILFFECIKGDQMRNKREIATMMSLGRDGFSRGLEHLRRQAAVGHITLYSIEQLCRHMITYYFRVTLGAYMDEQVRVVESRNESYATETIRMIKETRAIFVRFVYYVIKRAIKYHINEQSQLQSKIIGAIWFVIQQEHYPITAQQIDEATGGIKKNTFLKFSRAIIEHPRLFAIARRFFIQVRLDLVQPKVDSRNARLIQIPEAKPKIEPAVESRVPQSSKESCEPLIEASSSSDGLH